jgi:hypothetical protein
MRVSNKLLFFPLLVLPYFSCKKANTMVNVAPKEVVGKWKWIYTYLYATSPTVNPITPQNTGINEIITYYADKT